MTAKEMQAITQAVVAALQGSSPEQAPATPAKRGRGRPKGSKNRAKASPVLVANCITAEVAWQLLGGDEKFKPRDPSKPATNAQLWNLNAQGLLTVA